MVNLLTPLSLHPFIILTFSSFLQKCLSPQFSNPYNSPCHRFYSSHWSPRLFLSSRHTNCFPSFPPHTHPLPICVVLPLAAPSPHGISFFHFSLRLLYPTQLPLMFLTSILIYPFVTSLFYSFPLSLFIITTLLHPTSSSPPLSWLYLSSVPSLCSPYSSGVFQS
jgi:hypothetical protein